MTQAVIATTVTGLQARPIATTAPTANQSLTWNGTAWAPAGPFLPLTGGTLTGTLNFNYAGPFNTYTDTLVANNVGGLWRTYVNGGYFYIQCNTGASPNFATATLPFYGDHLGNANVGANLTVGAALTVGSSINAQLITATNNVTGANLVATTGGTYPNGPAGTGSVITANGSTGGWNWAEKTNQFAFICNGAADPVFQWLHQGIAALMNLSSVGNVGIAGTLTQGSDETLKTNISPLTQGISLIRQLIPKAFAWKAEPTEINWGFVAQDVQPVMPVAVGSTYPLEVGGPTTLTLDFNAILAAVTYALKQVDERLSAVEAHDGITPTAAQVA